MELIGFIFVSFCLKHLQSPTFVCYIINCVISNCDDTKLVFKPQEPNTKDVNIYHFEVFVLFSKYKAEEPVKVEDFLVDIL